MEKKKLDKKKLLLRILVVVLSVTLVALVAVVCVVNYTLGQIGSEIPKDTLVTIPPELADDETDEPEETLDPGYATEDPSEGSDPSAATDPAGTIEPTVPEATVPPTTEIQLDWPEVEQLYSKDVINIMLIGHDARGNDRARSDTMILLSIDQNHNTISLTSFMRDLYVQIPGGYKDNRMNAAYRFGGADLLDAVLQKNFGITVDGNVAVNFSQFEKIIDVLGGVEVELTAAEAAHLNEEGYPALKAGTNTLNGSEALAFCRIRKIDSDHNRTERQRRVLTALAVSAKSASLTELLGIVNEVLPYVDTDLTDSQIVSYTTSALSILSSGGGIQSYKIPEAGQYWGASIRGMSVLVPDLTACNQYLKAVLYG